MRAAGRDAITSRRADTILGHFRLTRLSGCQHSASQTGCQRRNERVAVTPKGPVSDGKWVWSGRGGTPSREPRVRRELEHGTRRESVARVVSPGGTRYHMNRGRTAQRQTSGFVFRQIVRGAPTTSARVRRDRVAILRGNDV